MATTAKLSLNEYERIVASGVFDWPNSRRIELIRGELREMNPIGPDHSEAVERLNEWSLPYVAKWHNPEFAGKILWRLRLSIANLSQIMLGFVEKDIPKNIQPPTTCSGNRSGRLKPRPRPVGKSRTLCGSGYPRVLDREPH